VKIKLNSIQIKCKLPILNYVKKDDEFLINLNYCTETVIHIRVEIFLQSSLFSATDENTRACAPVEFFLRTWDSFPFRAWGWGWGWGVIYLESREGEDGQESTGRRTGLTTLHIQNFEHIALKPIL
jgi:hypothetical protein